jgi:hypothetical protein
VPKAAAAAAAAAAMASIAQLQKKSSIYKRSSVAQDAADFKSRDASGDASSWVDDKEVRNCSNCSKKFGLATRKHHCRECGGIFCGPCSTYKVVISGTLKRVSTLRLI